VGQTSPPAPSTLLAPLASGLSPRTQYWQAPSAGSYLSDDFYQVDSERASDPIQCVDRRILKIALDTADVSPIKPCIYRENLLG
jgi:hypothetical protein